MNQLQEAQKLLKEKHGMVTAYIAKNGDIPAHLICNGLDSIDAIRYLNPMYGKRWNGELKKSENKFKYVKNMIFKKGAVTHANRPSIFDYYHDNDIAHYFKK